MILKLLLNTRIDMNYICKTIEECNSNKKCKILIVLDDMITDIVSNKKRKFNSHWIIYQR